MPAPVATRPAAGRARRLAAPGGVLAAGLLAACGLLLHDPHEPGSWGTCPFLALTGLPCPACGGLRAVDDLLRGDVLAALSSNAAVVLLAPLAGVGWSLWVLRRWRGTGRQTPPVPDPRSLAVAVAALLAFTVLRWGGPLAWLAP